MSSANGVDLNDVATFVRVAQGGGFTAAAKGLGVPKSTVSRAVAHEGGHVVQVDAGGAHAQTSAKRFPTRVNASMARSTISAAHTAESCTRMRDCPLGTTGYEKPMT